LRPSRIRRPVNLTPHAVHAARLPVPSEADGVPEAEFTALVRIAALVAHAPIALIGLADDTGGLRSCLGWAGVCEWPDDLPLCAPTLEADGVFEVADARADPRFAASAVVTGTPFIRFYAGVAIRLPDGTPIGILCVADHQPRTLDDAAREVLQQLAVAAGHALQGRRAALERDRAARVLADSEARFRTLSEASPLGVFQCDADGTCTYLNTRCQEIFGAPLEQLFGHGWRRAVHREDADKAEAGWRETVERGVEFDREMRVCLADAGVRYIRVLARPLRDEAGAVAGFVGTVADITERSLARERLQQSEERLRRLYESTPAMLHSIDGQGRLISVSDQWLAKLGYTREQVIGREPSDFMTAESRAYNKDVILPEFFVTGRSDNIHYQMVTAGGEVLDVQLSAILERDADGAPLRSMAVLEDITGRLKAEHALRHERQRLAHIIEGTQAGTWEWNVQTGEARYNTRWAAMLGREPEELPPTIDGWVPHIHPDDLVRASERVKAHIKGQQPHHECELRVRHRDGHWVWVWVRGQIKTWSADGRAEWMYGFFLDISERKQHEEALRKSEDLLNRMGQVAGIGGWSIDLDSDEVHWSDVACAIHGLPAGHRPARAELLEFFPAGAREALVGALDRAAARGESFDLELPLRRSDGSEIWVRVVGACEHDDGRPVRLVGAIQDITEQRRIKSELAEQHELLGVTLQSIGDGVITTDADGLVTWINPVAERMTGWRNEDAHGRRLAEVFRITDETTGVPARDPVLQCLQQGGRASLASAILLASCDGHQYGIEHSVSAIRNARGEVLGTVLVFRDVTEQRRLAEEMNWRATHDALTGLFNRTEFETRLRQVLDRAHQDGSQHALLYIDLDDFKLVNDACGHAVGDQMLQQVGKLLSSNVRTRDAVARLGGDEFAVILDHCPVDHAQRVAQQICDRMDDFRFTHEGRRFRVGTSIGVVPIDRRWTTTAAILQAADTSCYAAKSAGRNRLHLWFDTDLAMRARQGEMHWATRIEQALDDNRFVLYAQRILPLATGEDDGIHAEVLLRMLDADGNAVPPGAFLPAAERFHLASRIDRWVVRNAIDWLKTLPDPTLLSTFSINLSGQSISDRAFHAMTIDMLEEAGPVLCARLCLEITETATVTNLADAAEFMRRVRSLGVQIALDDFGAGASSFGYLKALPVDALKIDGQFISDIIDDPLDEAAVRCFVDVARVVGVRTVAEFVDRPEVLAKVREVGIDYAQGFLVHRPEPLERLLVATLAPVA